MCYLIPSVLYLLASLSVWDMVGEIFANSVVFVLMERSNVGVCSAEAERSAFLFLALEASGMSAADVGALGEVRCSNWIFQSKALDVAFDE
ncbi:hypothetical protein V6N13_101307 [Hibiscus sabdariffa]